MTINTIENFFLLLHISLRRLFTFLIGRRQPRTIQEIFNAIIDGGTYGSDCSRHMCVSSAAARDRGTITLTEYLIVRRGIKSYIPHWSLTLANALLRSGLDSSFNNRLKIYRDWENRPPLSRSYFND